MRFRKRLAGWLLLALALAGCGASFAQTAQTQGVTKDEVVLGSLLDLSGPVSVIGTYVRQGMEQEIETINAAGGIHGRKLRLVVEDTGYDPRRAIVGARKLLGQDKVFALLGAIGSPVFKVTMPLANEAGVPFLFPSAPLQEAYDPPKRLVFAYMGSYLAMFEAAGPFIVQKLGKKRACVLAQDDDFGEEVTRGLQAGLKSVGSQIAEQTTFKRGATDFSSQVAKLKAADCDFVVLAAAVKDAAGIASERRKQGWNVPMMVGPGASLTPLIALSGGAADGIYGLALWPPIDELRGRPQVAKVIDAYEKTYRKPFDDLVLTGHQTVAMTAEGLRRAGPDLTVDSFVAGLQQMKDFDPGFGFAPMSFDAEHRLGTSTIFLTQVQGPKWVGIGRLQ